MHEKLPNIYGRTHCRKVRSEPLRANGNKGFGTTTERRPTLRKCVQESSRYKDYKLRQFNKQITILQAHQNPTVCVQSIYSEVSE